MDTIGKIIGTGIPVDARIVLPLASVTSEGYMTVGIGWEVNDDTKVTVMVESKPASKQIAEGLVAVINGVRQQVGVEDDSKGVLTLAEAAEILLGIALGKRG